LVIAGAIVFVTMYGLPDSIASLLKSQVITSAATAAQGVYYCDTPNQQVASADWQHSVDPDTFTANQAYGANTLLSSWFNNSSGTILQTPNWGSSPTKFFK